MGQRYKEDLLNQRIPQRVDCVIDQFAAIVKGHNPDTVRQTRPKRRDLCFDVLNNLPGVGAVTDDDDTADRINAILVEYSAAELGTQLHGCHVTDRDRCVIGVQEHNVFNVRDRTDQSEAANDEFAIVGFNDFGADVTVTALNCIEDHAYRYVVAAQPGRIDVDLILANESADTGHLSNARDGIQLVSDEPVLQRP